MRLQKILSSSKLRHHHLHHTYSTNHYIIQSTTPSLTHPSSNFHLIYFYSYKSTQHNHYYITSHLPPPTHDREFPNISKAVRAEFARGDGRVKRKEDDRRKIITPNETLFVVNFSEETTKKEDLEMLFSKFGDLVRIDMKRNYAFVQYTTTEDATKAKDATNGGQLDQNVITVECE